MTPSANPASNPLNIALGEIITRFHAETGTIHFLGTDGMLHLAASQGIPQPVLNIIAVVPVGKGMAGLAAERRAAVTACNIQTDSSGDVRPGAKATGMEGAIVVPIIDGGTLRGTLGIANRNERTFSPAEQSSLLTAAAELSSLAPAAVSTHG